VLPGPNLLREILQNDRIIGGFDEVSNRLSGEVYRSFVRGQLLFTNDVTAELCKVCYISISLKKSNQKTHLHMT
jgi:UDP-N-acetyl-D-mannosaminuronic acid dehydrogenase